MNIDDVIVFEDNNEYMILDMVDYNNSKYTYTVKLDEEELPTSDYKYFEIFEENGEYSVLEVTDNNIKQAIETLFKNNLDKNKEQAA